jgi:ferritin-like metal-binding protein YciE
VNNYNAKEFLSNAIQMYPDLKENIQEQVNETIAQLDKADRVAKVLEKKIVRRVKLPKMIGKMEPQNGI